MFDNTRKALESRFRTLWSDTPIEWENVAFSPPNSGEYIRFVILFGRNRQASIGFPVREKCSGIISISIFAPKLSGTDRAAALADQAAGIFRHQILQESDTQIRCLVPQCATPREITDYLQADLTVPFITQESF